MPLRTSLAVALLHFVFLLPHSFILLRCMERRNSACDAHRQLRLGELDYTGLFFFFFRGGVAFLCTALALGIRLLRESCTAFTLQLQRVCQLLPTLISLPRICVTHVQPSLAPSESEHRPQGVFTGAFYGNTSSFGGYMCFSVR